MSIDRPAPLACIECRRKHLKCDAKMPICDRCAAAGRDCRYSPSRRGLKRKSTFTSTTLSPVHHLGFATIRDFSDMPSAIPEGSVVDESVRHRQLNAETIHDEGLVNLFYTSIHPTHPLLVPRFMYNEMKYPEALKLVVQFAGSHFTTDISSDGLRRVTIDAALSNDSRDYHMVQARLLLAIVLHARGEINESVDMLAFAVSLAIELGINHREFASTHGNHSFIVEESIRRTWWELYVIDGLMAALQRKASFVCYTATSDVPLPCDETLYHNGISPSETLSLAQFDARIYDEEERKFSSFAYRIDAVRILARVLPVAWTHQVHRDHVQAIDNAIAAWWCYLPPGQGNDSGDLSDGDEMLFQARMLIQYSIMYLHFPRSDLVSALPAAREVIREKLLLPTSHQGVHTFKAVQASKQIGDLASLQCQLSARSPFLICYIVFSIIVQLSACAACRPGSYDRHWDQISIITGLLKAQGNAWDLAHVTLRKIKRMIAEIFQHQSQGPLYLQGSSHDSGIGGSQASPFLEDGGIPWVELLGWADHGLS